MTREEFESVRAFTKLIDAQNLIGSILAHFERESDSRYQDLSDIYLKLVTFICSVSEEVANSISEE